MYTIYTFELSGWTRVVRINSEEENKLKTLPGFKRGNFESTKEECEKQATKLNNRIRAKDFCKTGI